MSRILDRFFGTPTNDPFIRRPTTLITRAEPRRNAKDARLRASDATTWHSSGLLGRELPSLLLHEPGLFALERDLADDRAIERACNRCRGRGVLILVPTAV